MIKFNLEINNCNMFVETITILVICVAFLVTIYMGRRDKNLPPGPIPLPIVGNLLQIAIKGKRKPYVAFDKIGQEYGGIYTLRFGSSDIVVLTSYEAMKDTLGKSEWSGRIWDEYIAKRYLNQRLGMIFLEGENWKEQRKFALGHLRDFGFGKQKEMENIISQELIELNSEIKKGMADGKQTTIYMHNFFNLSVVNVLWTMVAGIRYSHDNQKLISLIETTDLLFKSQNISGMGNLVPFLKKLFPSFCGETQQIAAYQKLHDFFREEIKAHRKSESFGSSAHFMDVFLQEVDKGRSDKLFTEDQLICICTDFFIAGSETTSHTLAFAVLYMILYPEIQEKIHKEITSVIGSNERPSLDHRTKLPYTEACLMEIQRIAVIAPIAPPHRTLENVTYRGYSIPKGTVAMLNLYSIHMSPKYWKNPQAFCPERFLDENGSVLRSEFLTPFGIGKRICPGESLAKMQLFLYFTTLLKTFKFQTVAGHLDPTAEPQPGLTLSPKPFNVVVIIR